MLAGYAVCTIWPYCYKVAICNKAYRDSSWPSSVVCNKPFSLSFSRTQIDAEVLMKLSIRYLAIKHNFRIVCTVNPVKLLTWL